MSSTTAGPMPSSAPAATTIPSCSAASPSPRSPARDCSRRPTQAEAPCSALPRRVATRANISSVHATFVVEHEAELARASGWLVRHDTQFHWHNHGFASFEEFLGTLSSRHRKVTRRERRDALGSHDLTVRWLTGSDLTEAAWDAFFEFYQDTGSRKWGRPYLNRQFFSLLSEAMADRVLLMIAYDGDRPIAGTLSLIGRDRLYGRYWGATRDVPFLHFELCYYQAIDYAIAHKLAGGRSRRPGRAQAGARLRTRHHPLRALDRPSRPARCRRALRQPGTGLGGSRTAGPRALYSVPARREKLSRPLRLPLWSSESPDWTGNSPKLYLPP